MAFPPHAGLSGCIQENQLRSQGLHVVHPQAAVFLTVTQYTFLVLVAAVSKAKELKQFHINFFFYFKLF